MQFTYNSHTVFIESMEAVCKLCGSTLGHCTLYVNYMFRRAVCIQHTYINIISEINSSPHMH